MLLLVTCSAADRERRRALGYVPQGLGLYRALTAARARSTGASSPTMA